MPKTVSVTKEMIIDAAFNITRSKGFSKLSNREIAKYLNCSIRPIYYQFKDVDDLNKHLFKKVVEYFYNYLTSDIKYKDKVYLSTGINYIKFAMEENNLFRLMFMSDKSVTNFIKEEDRSFTEYTKIVVNKTNLDIKQANDFHFRMWIYTHGIACLCVTKTISFTDEEIKELLTKEFRALMLIEKEGK